MVVCPACERENADDARFCSACGAALVPAEPARGEVRKTVTVFFSDVVGSTAVGERLDPESLRRVMGRYFDAMSAVLEHHGATVEKYSGDAIMAVFGIPLLHEDDALRAVRAAAEMRERLVELNEELERDYGVRIEARTGVNTGEVVAGDASSAQRLVTGDAVNTAARLEQAAQAGEVLLGEQTWRLVRDAVEADEVAPVEAKGKADRVAAYRLRRVVEGAEPFARRFESPLVGRERELALLRQAYRRAVDERASHLFTLLGAAGIGKSRLVQEFLGEVGDEAKVLVGHCLSYGEGITYWPLVEILEQLGSGEEVARVVESEQDAPLIVNRVLGAVGLAEDAGSPEEIPWAVRKLLEALARERPLVVVLDDLQWAEPTFLELVEHLADWSRGAPILLLCLARPELLDEYRAWGGGKLNATTILLEPLGADDADVLIDNLLAGTALQAETRSRIAEAAEGNPLFVEQMLAMLSDDGAGNGAVTVPPTIQALLAARLDRLATGERDAIERASVVGKEFWRRAIAELSLEPATVAPALQALVRKELVRPHRPSTFPREDAFRFRHLLIKDAAYAGLPKELRAELHERFARWLETERSEYDEIVGYHLEQAYRYRAELGPLDDRARELGREAGGHLGAAGERALARSDVPAAANLLARAIDLLPAHDPGSAELRLGLADAQEQAGDLNRAATLLDDLIAAEPPPRTRWRARVHRTRIGLLRAETTADEAAATAEEAIRELAKLDDHGGLAHAWQLAGDARNTLGDTAGIEAAMHQALVHAREAQDTRLETECMSWLGLAAFFGATPVAEARSILDELAASASTPHRRADVLLWSSAIAALAGDCEGGSAGVVSARAIYADLGLKTHYGATAHAHGLVELLCGRPAEAERVLREGSRALEEAGEKGVRSTELLALAESLHEQGRHDEAEQIGREASALSPPDDALNDTTLRHMDAKLAAARGEGSRAEELAREAVELFEQLDTPLEHGRALMTLADLLRAGGKTTEAQDAATRALQVFERKGVVPAMERAKRLLAELAPA
jgi:class 3 adenylate cyclase/tetratricopeptide (TPR) repeat protein